MLKTMLAALAAVGFAGGAHAQIPVLATGFEASDGFTPGAIDAGANEGNSNWQAAANGSTFGTVVSGIAHSGTQSLAIGNNGSGNDGVIQGVRSPELPDGAGEAASGAFNDLFFASLWFRSGEWAPGADYFASINAWSTDRMSYVALDYTGGVFRLYGIGMTDGDEFVEAPIATGLAEGQWYRLDQTLDFYGYNSAGGDDIVTFELFDESGARIASTVTTSWDAGYLGLDRFYPGARLTPVDQLNFRTAYTTPGIGFYIDDVSFSAPGVPEPASWAMMIGGIGLAGGTLRRRLAGARAAA